MLRVYGEIICKCWAAIIYWVQWTVAELEKVEHKQQLFSPAKIGTRDSETLLPHGAIFGAEK